jgi:epoxyqueuosine reductase
MPRELRPLVGDHVFGCDVCQAVCPFNGVARPGAPELSPRPGYARPELAQLLGMGAAQFRKWQRRSALRRIHRAQLQRNVAVALGNVGGAAELPALAQALGSPHALVRAHVAWAMGRILAREGSALSASARVAAQALLDAALARESDAEARSELAAAGAATFAERRR